MNSQQNHEQQIGFGSEQQIKYELSNVSCQPTYIDVVAAMPGCEDKELIKCVRASRDDKGRILLNSVCQRLQELGFKVAGTLVSYYSPIDEMYTFVGKEPIPLEKDGVPIENLSKNRLHLKFRPGQDSSPVGGGSALESGAQGNQPTEPSFLQMTGTSIPSLNNMSSFGQSSAPPAPVPIPTPAIPPTSNAKIANDNESSDDKGSNGDENKDEIWSSSKANRRTKERKISFVIEKVSMWRKLYNGIQDNQGKIVRYSLEDAAKKVGISKKSLDDYLLQLRYGKKYGFDFNEHKEAKIGILRAFVKKCKQDEKEKQKRKNDDDSDE